MKLISYNRKRSSQKGNTVGKNGVQYAASSRGSWTFLSNHAHVLVCLARDSGVRMRDVAEQVGITERAVVNIINELEECGVITRIREGRRNRYEIDVEVGLRHPIEANRSVGSLLKMALEPAEARRFASKVLRQT